jgi:Domain of unknown function (DUF4389)
VSVEAEERVMSTAVEPSPEPLRRSHWGPGAVAALVGGSLLALVGAILVLSGIGLMVAHAVLRDDDGYFTSPTERFSTPTYALTAEEIKLGEIENGTGNWAVDNLAGTVRLHAELASGAPVFVGIARERDLDAFLAGVAHDRVTDLNDGDFRYDRARGARAPAEPARQRFWAASASGPGEQVAQWKVKEGRWAVVVMRADARRGVAADASMGAKVGWLIWLGLALLAAGALALGGGAALIIGASHHAESGGGEAAALAGAPAAAEQDATEAEATAAAAGPAHPATIEARLDEPLSPWLWLVKWFLAIPHFIVLALLWIAFVVITVVALFAILFTGRYPRALFDFGVGVLRWTWRVEYYATGAIATDSYPPFSLASDPSYPADLDIPYPERLSRGKALVKWLLAVPHLAIVAAFLGGGWWWSEGAGPPGVLTVLVLVAGFVLLFTRRYPRDVFTLVVGINRWVLRVVAYVALMRDEYPPFRLDR